MGRITRDNLDKSLQEAIDNIDVDLSNYPTKDDLQEAIDNVDVSDKQDKTDNSLLTNDKSLVGAINELFQSANNGKQLIASAIGNEFINGNSTFKAMSEAILALRSSSDNETDAKEVLYNMMIEDGYNEATSNMTVDELIQLLDDSQISVNEIKQIVCGYGNTFILKNDGSVWACGGNSSGELGLGDNTRRTTFTQVDISDVEQIACGLHTFILKNDGSVWSCGYNSYGQLGLGDATKRNTFTKVTTNINNDVKQIACGYWHTFILKNDGSVWACGDNMYGQLGLGNTTTKNTFTQVTTNINNDVKQIACGSDFTFILKNDGSVWACGYNEKGQLGLNNTTDKTTFTQVTTNISDVKEVICGANHTFILKNDGSVWSCGRNNYGQLCLGDDTDRNTFTKVTTNINNDVKQIVCGDSHTFIIKNDGSVWSCGNNNGGQLGLGDNTKKSTFTQVTTNINNDVKQIVCGTHTVILKNDDSVWSCGFNSDGQLGLGDTTNRNTFTQVLLSSQSIDEYEINRLKLYYYLLDNEVEVTESMDIGTMLDLLVDDYVNNMINGYYNNLKLVLIDEGVEVTEEDDMNDLIVKVDEELDRKNSEMIKFASGTISNTFFNHTHNVQSNANGGTTASTIYSLQANVGTDCSYYSIIYEILAQSNSKYYRIKEVHTYDRSKSANFVNATHIYTETNASGTTNGAVYGGGQNYRPVIQENIAIIPMFTIQMLNLPNVTTVNTNYYCTVCKDHVDTPYIEPEAPPIADLYILNNGYGSDVRFDTYWGPTYSSVSTNGWNCGSAKHVCTTTKINFSDYSKVVIKGKSTYAGGVYIHVAACSTNIQSNSGNIPTDSGITICEGYVSAKANTEFELTINISKLTGSQYLAIYSSFPTGANMASPSGTISVFKLTN